MQHLMSLNKPTQLSDGEALRIVYICPSGSVFDWGRARALLGANAPDAIWSYASKNEVDNTYRVNGTKDGVETYYASLTDDGKMLVIWTKEDDEAGRTSPNTRYASALQRHGLERKEYRRNNDAGRRRALTAD